MQDLQTKREKNLQNFWRLDLQILSGIFGPSTTGTVYAFGYTLLTGVIANFIMGVGFSRLMIKSIARLKFLRKKTFFGGAKNEE